jgi:nitrite reductase/ring-hydroxylating ferredoxin subunit
MASSPEPTDGPDCAGCALHEDRRRFLRDAALAVAGAFAALGAPRGAHASALRFVTALSAGGSTAVYPVPAADGATIDRERQVIVVRHKGAVYAFALSCPHQNTALKWRAEDARFQCPKHKSKYQPDGTFISGRATRGMDRYAVQRRGNTIVVDVSKLYRQDENRAGWDAAVARVTPVRLAKESTDV